VTRLGPGRAPCSSAHGKFCSEEHRDLVDAYRLNVAAVEWQRTHGYAPTDYAYGSTASVVQLEEHELREAFPFPQFPEHVVAWHEARRRPDHEQEDEAS
jgi:hypothetical protein